MHTQVDSRPKLQVGDRQTVYRIRFQCSTTHTAVSAVSSNTNDLCIRPRTTFTHQNLILSIFREYLILKVRFRRMITLLTPAFHGCLVKDSTIDGDVLVFYSRKSCPCCNVRELMVDIKVRQAGINSFLTISFFPIVRVELGHTADGLRRVTS